MVSTKAEQAWAGLNERQRLYLSTIFDMDQAAERDIKASAARWERTPPAAEWRQITYDIKLPKEIAGYSSVQSVLRKQGEHDTGSGSTLAALRTRGLITVTHDRVEVFGLGWVPRIRVRLTTLGRAAARAGTGVTAPASPPRGLMARWSFAALARLYAVGELGLSMDYSADRAERAPSWNTLLNLRDRRDGPFIDEFFVRRDGGGSNSRVRLTEPARRHYELHHACYRQLYPDLDAPDPDQVLIGAHTGLADHRARRPRRLLRDTDLRALAALTGLEATNSCYWRHVLTQQYERMGEDVPDAVHTMPCGMLRWQVSELTRSDKSIDRLRDHPDGPLIEVVDAPNQPYDLDERPTLALVVLTPRGRDHYARHLDEYRTAYPELDLPSPNPPSTEEQ